jgi:hypothetical protein
MKIPFNSSAVNEVFEMAIEDNSVHVCRAIAAYDTRGVLGPGAKTTPPPSRAQVRRRLLALLERLDGRPASAAEARRALASYESMEHKLGTDAWVGWCAATVSSPRVFFRTALAEAR